MQWLWTSRCVEKSNWHFWFAWHPVCVKQYDDGTVKLVWLQKVLRKGTPGARIAGYDWFFEYKEI